MSEVKAREFTNWIHYCKSPHKNESICIELCDQVQSIELTAEVKNAIKSFDQLQSENKQLREKLKQVITSNYHAYETGFNTVEEFIDFEFKQLTQNGGEDAKS